MLRKTISESEVLQSAVCQVLHISVIDVAQRMLGVAGRVCSGAREISIGILFAPNVGHEISRDERCKWTDIRAPEFDIVICRIPILMSYALEKCGNVKSQPFESQVQTIGITCDAVADFYSETRIVQCACPAIVYVVPV